MRYISRSLGNFTFYFPRQDAWSEIPIMWKFNLSVKAMTDGTKRKLDMPAWHIPYLEKHRIHELFHELARELVIQQPVDHVLFLKQVLYQAAKSRDVPRLLLLGSPKVNCYEVAKEIAFHTGQTIITEQSILTLLNKASRVDLRAKTIAKCLARLVRVENVFNTGWIFVDCIKTKEEARKLLELGILPTHVIYLVSPFCPPLDDLLYCSVRAGWPEYRRRVMGIRDAFKHVLLEVHIRQKNLPDVVHECLELLKIQKGRGGPKQVRLLILGPRGSGRKTQAKMLNEKLNLVNVDFEYILCQAWISQTEIGEKLRACKQEVCFHSDLLAEVVNRRILEADCLEYGWVLTGFPYTVLDFKYLDSLDTPPNRVIFLESDLNVCKERLIHRRVNVYTGSVTNLMEESESILGKHLAMRPKDRVELIEAELNYYCEQYGALRSYSGGTASVVNGDQPQRWVFECISAIIVRGAPACPPRDPCTAEVLTSSASVEGNSGTLPSTPVLSGALDAFVTKT